MSPFATLLLSLVVRYPLDQTVSATVRAMPAPKAIAELAKQTGVPLTAMQSVKDDVLIIRVKDVPLGVLMDKIATTIHAGWEKDGDGYRLVRTDAMRRQEEAMDVVEETKLYEAGIQAKRKALDVLGVLDDKKATYVVQRLKAIHDRMDPNGVFVSNNDWRSTQEVTDQSPANRALLRVCAMLKAEDLAKLPYNKRIVYSTQPTRMQVQMPGNMSQIMADFKRETALMADANSRIMGGAERSWMFGDQSLYGQSAGVPTKVLLSAFKNPYFGGIQLQLQIANEKGKLMGTANSNFSRDYEAMSKTMAAENNQKEEPIKLSPDSEALRDKMSVLIRPNATPAGPLPADVLAKVLKPEDNDPLSFVVTDVLFEVARAKNLNLVAAPPDIALMAMTAMPATKPSAALTMLTMPELGGVVADGWLTEEAPTQSQFRSDRIDRPSLGNLLRAAMKKGKLTIDDAAAFALKNGSDQTAWLLSVFLATLGQADARFQGWNWDALRLYGTFTPSQSRTFQAKQPLSLQALTPQQQAIVHKMVFDSQYVNLNMAPQVQMAGGNQQEDFEAFYNGLGREPTEAMPNGIPFDGTLTVEFQRDSVVFLGNVDGNPQWMTNRAFTATELAWEVYQRERKDLFPWMSDSNQGPVKFDKLRLGDRLLVNMTFKFTKVLTMATSLQENTYGEGQEFSISNLPDSFKKAYETAYNQQVEQYKNMKPGQFGGGGGQKQNIPPQR